nr:MAG TPA: hypothetical protein [Caudoviricetes sp.]DAT87366.1 MAG TPA: hypothetical protein [Caudoviricetes sp.]
MIVWWTDCLPMSVLKRASKRRSAHWRIHCTRLSLLRSRLFP